MSSLESKPQPPFVLSLDIGTSSVRALVFDRLGQPWMDTLVRQDYPLKSEPPGSLTADPDQLLETVWTCMDASLRQAGRSAKQLAAVATCTFAGSTLGLDASGKPVTPLILYADTRSAPDANRLKEQLDEPAFHQRTGVRFHSSYLPARLLWLARTEPGVFKRVQHWATLGEYMSLQLFGEMVVSSSIASWIGMENISLVQWEAELLQVLPIARENLSPIVDASQSQTNLREPFRSRWPELAAIPWFPAIGDGAAANLGSGCTSTHQVAVTIGTSSAVRSVLQGQVPRIPPGLWCYRVDASRILFGGALSEGGNVFVWLTGLMGLQPSAALDGAIDQLPADGSQLTFLPLIAGERSPGWHGDARGVLTGLSLSMNRLEVLKAGMEGVAYRIALVYDQLRPVLPDEPEIIASGGALQNSPAWSRILADVLGKPIAVSRVKEASARGNALLALEYLGLLDQISQAPAPEGPIYHADAARHTRYLAAITRQQELYQKFLPQPETRNSTL